MEQYYISSNKYSIQERKTKKRGKVYDVVFRITAMDSLETSQKKLTAFSTKALAKQAYLDFVHECCLPMPRHIKAERKDASKQEYTVGQLLPEYLSSLPNQNKDSSIYDKKKIYDRFILPEFENVKLSSLTKERLYRWQDKIWSAKKPESSDGYSYAYLDKVRTHFGAFLRWCESRYGYKNNMPSVQKPKKRASKSEMKFWTKDQFDQFISAVENPMWHALFTLMFYTGRRKGELFALSPSDIKLKDKIPSLIFNKTISRKTIDGSPYQITSTKADKSQKVPVCNTVIEELGAYDGQAPFFFGGDTPLAENTVTRNFKRYCRKADIEPIRIHDLRHSFVSMLIHLGANYMVVADLIGDTPEQVLKTYGHLYISDKMEIINSLNNK